MKQTMALGRGTRPADAPLRSGQVGPGSGPGSFHVVNLVGDAMATEVFGSVAFHEVGYVADNPMIPVDQRRRSVSRGTA